MGGIVIKHKVILLTKRRLIIYALIALALILAIIGVIRLMKRTEEPTTSSNTFVYLQYKDGKYIGNEKTDKGNIKVEVTIKKNRIEEIKILEFPKEYIAENRDLEKETTEIIDKIIKTQEIMSAEDAERSSYVINKLLKAIRIAVDQSLLQ
ncbi:MAG: hypothetical protein GX201_02080 [Clostridiales bacterium]|nr:hypothetical protein [Clostridiales bacterium]